MSRQRDKRKDANGRKLTRIERVDIAVARAAAVKPKSAAGRTAQFICGLGDQPPLLLGSGIFLAAGIGLRDRRMVRTGITMIAGLGLATAAKTFGKDNIDRTRPNAVVDKGRYKLDEGDSGQRGLRSMPSGHTAGVVAVTRAASRAYPAAATPLALGAATIVGAQLPSRNHFLSDLMAGMAIGLLSERIASWLVGAADRRLPTAV